MGPVLEPGTLHAQSRKTTVTGTILDQETGEPVPFANVAVLRITRSAPEGEPVSGTMSGEDGTYSVELDAGSYTFIYSHFNYQSTEVERVWIPPGAKQEINAYLTSGTITVDKMVVEGETVKSAEGGMLTTLRKETEVADAVTAEQIARTTDSNAAEALERMTGVTVVGSRYVYVRGLGERYSSSRLNGVSIGTPEPNKRVLPLDIFPTGILDNVVVQKTYSPDMEGEFGGSVININTKEFSKNGFTQSLALGYTSTSEADYLGYRGGSLDFLGIDDGTRALPKDVADSGKRINSQNFSVDEVAGMAKSFENVWTPAPTNSSPNFAYSAAYSRGMSLFGRPSGLLLSGSLSNSFKSLEMVDNVYSGSKTLPPLFLYDVHLSSRSVLGGLNGSLSMDLNPVNKMRLNLLYTRSADDDARISEGQNFDRGSYARNTQLAYVERGLFASILQGDHQTGLLNADVDWSLSYSWAMRNEPDRRNVAYEKTLSDSTFAISGISTYPISRIYGESDDYVRNAFVNVKIPFREDQEVPSRLGLGLFYVNKNRDSGYRRFGFTSRFSGGQSVDRTQLPEQLLAPDELDRGGFRLEELTRPNDSYTADQTVKAAYLMAEVPLGSRVRAMAGARYEVSGQQVDAQSPFAVNDRGTQVEQTDDTVLPAATLTVMPHRKMNLRMAYSKTVNRPELRELSPFNMINWETGYEETGNPDLQTARIDNYDLRWELYPGPSEFVALGAFYKEFDRPITKFVAPNVGGYALRPQNGKAGTLYGWEGEVRVSAVSVWSALDWMLDLGATPRALGSWSFVVNYSRIHSEVEVQNSRQQWVTIPFAGQSTYSLNTGLFYKKAKWEGSLLYNAFGPRLDAFGFGSLPSIYEYSAKGLDLTLSHKVSPQLFLKFGAENLLDESTVYRQGPKVTQEYKSGRTLALSVTNRL